jgi:glycosyltransferase involved in cell wall biosynthesis
VDNLGVIVPFYNEKNTLAYSIDRLLAQNIFSEIILSDDNSNDDSDIIAKHYQEQYENIKYIKSSTNKGKGNALNNAKNHITTKFVVIHDADLEYFPEDLVEMFEKAKLNPQSLIIGSRFIGNKERTNIYRRTYIANKVMSLFFSLVHFRKISDIATCYKMMMTDTFKEIELYENGFSIEIEIVSKFLKKYKSIIEIPIKYEGRSYEEGKKIKPMDGVMYLINTIKYKIY